MGSGDKMIAIVITSMVVMGGIAATVGIWVQRDTPNTYQCSEACGDRGVHTVTATVCTCK